MKVKDLQEFLGSFTEGSEAIKNAVLFVEINGKPGIQARAETSALLPFEDFINDLFCPPRFSNKIVTSKKHLLNAEPTQTIKLRNN